MAGPVLVSLGSNLDPLHYLPLAVQRLAQVVRVVAVSKVFRTPAVGSPDSPPFRNAAVELECDAEPAELKFEVLRPIEAALGRVRTADPNAPRTIDLDITLFGDLVIDDGTRLVLPDPDLLLRAHVALPVADLAPDMLHPVVGRPLAEIAAELAAVSDFEIDRSPELTALARSGPPEERAPEPGA